MPKHFNMEKHYKVIFMTLLVTSLVQKNLGFSTQFKTYARIKDKFVGDLKAVSFNVSLVLCASKCLANTTCVGFSFKTAENASSCVFAYPHWDQSQIDRPGWSFYIPKENCLSKPCAEGTHCKTALTRLSADGAFNYYCCKNSSDDVKVIHLKNSAETPPPYKDTLVNHWSACRNQCYKDIRCKTAFVKPWCSGSNHCCYLMDQTIDRFKDMFKISSGHFFVKAAQCP